MKKYSRKDKDKNFDIRKEWDLKIIMISKNETAHLFQLLDLHQKKRKNSHRKNFHLKFFFVG